MSIAPVDDPLIAALIAQRIAHAGEVCGWADFEVRGISGERYLRDEAITALGFRHVPDVEAVSCDVCGVLFRDALRFMKRHRLQCGWEE